LSTVDNITCPVCDAEIPNDSKKCPVCGVDLGLFDLEGTDINEIESDGSLDELMDVLDDEMDEDEFLEKIKSIGGEASNGVSAEEDMSEEAPEAVSEEEIIIFECPVCGADVAEDDSSCPNCGAIFEEDEEDYPEYEEELKEALSIARDSLATVREINMGVPVLKDLLKKIVDAKKSDDYETGMEALSEIRSSVEKISDINEMMITGKKKVKEVKAAGMDYKPYLKELKACKELVDQGLYGEATNKLDATIDNILEALEKMDETEDEEIKEELDAISKEVKSALSECRKTNLDISNLKELVKSAMTARKNKEYSRGIEIGEETLELSQKMLEVSSLLDESKEYLRTMRENGIDFKQYINSIKDGKKLAEEMELDRAINGIRSTIKEMDKNIEDQMKELETEERIASEIEPKLEEVDRTIEDLQNSKLPIDSIIDLRTEIDNYLDDKEFEVAIDKVEELTIKCGEAVRTRILLEESKSRLKELKEGGGDFKELLKSTKEAKRNAEKGEYGIAIDILTSNIEKLEEALESLEEQEKVSVKDVEAMVSELRSLLMTARDNGIKVKDGKKIIEKAIRSTAAKDFEHTISLLNEGKKKIIDKIANKIDEKMVSLELIIEEEGEVEDVEEILDDVKKNIKNENYKLALENISLAEERVKTIEVSSEDTSEFITEAEQKINDAEKLGFDVSRSKDIISSAKEDLINGDKASSKEKAEKAIEEISAQIPAQLKAFVKTAQKELKTAKISGIDISEPISLLKQASFAREEEDYEKCFEYMNKYQEVMEDKLV